VAAVPTAASLVPPDADLDTLRSIAAGCRACPLWKDATQTVFGEGPPRARWMLVGEVPGDREDLAGHPFVGPAGRLLDTCLAEVGLDRSEAWITNVVKHFKYKRSGKRRLHETPRWTEIVACRPWAEAEIDRVRPEVLVLLGATAGKALIGRDFKVSVARGKPIDSPLAPVVLATVHPSSLLRRADAATHASDRAAFVSDLALIRSHLGS
jgi:uracil-DNA glycosylase